jgi:hypothetical protein
MLKVTAITVVAVCAGSAVAGPVHGDVSTYHQIGADQVTMISLEEGTQGASNTVYSNIDAGPGGYQAFPPANGVLGFDDYTSTEAGSVTLDSIRFVGGVELDGGGMIFEFFNSAGDTFIDGFSVALPTGGNFIWTINLGGTVTVDGAGILQVSTDATSNGQWFLSDGGPVIGSEDGTFGGASGGALAHNFELNAVPAPGSVALLGLSGLVATRRRR